MSMYDNDKTNDHTIIKYICSALSVDLRNL